MAFETATGFVHLDVDTSVLPCFGDKEGALPGPNPRFRGRPSFHPILARIAETDALVGMRLRPGNTAFGVDDLPTVRGWVRRAKSRLRRGSHLCVRMDAAGDFGALLAMLDEEQTFYVVKARTTADVLSLVHLQTDWTTTDRDALHQPTRQVCELPFCRRAWSAEGISDVRVIAVRSRDRQGKQLHLGDDFGWTVQLFLTNRPREESHSDVAWDYDGRAGIEALIADLKQSWGLPLDRSRRTGTRLRSGTLATFLQHLSSKARNWEAVVDLLTEHGPVLQLRSALVEASS